MKLNHKMLSAADYQVSSEPYIAESFIFFTAALSDTNKQAVLCHRVLRTIQTVATESIVMTRQTWESLLRFLLAVNDTILAPPLEAGTSCKRLQEGRKKCREILGEFVLLYS